MNQHLTGLRQRVVDGSAVPSQALELIMALEDRIRELEAELEVLETDRAAAYMAQYEAEETARREDANREG